MFVFEANSRIQKIAEGIQFYEQDVLCSEYDFEGNQKIEVRLDYVSPGFGLVFVENDDIAIADSFNAYMFKLGADDFRVFYKHFGKQEEIHAESCHFAPGQGMTNTTLIFEMKDKVLSVSLLTLGVNGDRHENLLVEYECEKFFQKYRIGFYSNAGNIIRSIAFLNEVPDSWHTSIWNTIGGRISFERTGIRIENCEHYAEIEQQSLDLSPGKYWLGYSTEEVNGKCDAVAYIIDATETTDGREVNFEDEYKNILQEDGSFIVGRGMRINLKFRARNALIKDIFISDTEHSSFVETRDEESVQKGSKIIIDLRGLRKVIWQATVYAVPPYTDFSKESPFAIIDTPLARYSDRELSIRLGKAYQYTFDVATSTLEIYDIEERGTVFNGSIFVGGTKMTIMDSVTATVTKLITINNNGKESNIIIMKTFKKYVPANITSPIIVTKTNSTTSFNLSSAFREVAETSRRIDLFNRESPLILKEQLPVNAKDIRVYGIPYGSELNMEATNIDKLTNQYIDIEDYLYDRKGNSVLIEDDIRNRYEFIAVEHDTIQDFYYEFTNYEREIFPGTQQLLELAHAPARRDEDITVYAVKKDTPVHDEYFYRVPSESLMNSIDFYADDYEIIPPSLYYVDFNTYEIMFKGDVADGRYKEFIIDYLKLDSYAINYRGKYFQYEVDIATDESEVILHYDSQDDGNITEYVRTEIVPDKDKYIVLKKGGANK